MWLRGVFPDSVVEPIRMHVPAKRYLCSVDAEYWDSLSDSSKHSLELQGGRFTDTEAEAFISQPHAPEAVMVRRWDDRAKESGLQTETVEFYLNGVVSDSMILS